MGNKESEPDYTSQRYLHPEIYTLDARNPQMTKQTFSSPLTN